jgi:hypothetical protein
MHLQQSASAPEGGWLPGILWGKESPVELRLNASSEILCSQRAGHRFRTKTRAARVGNEARGAYMRNKRQAQACVGYSSRYAKARHLPCAVMAGRVFADARTRGMLCRAGLDIMGNQYASVAKSTMIVVVIASCCIRAVFHRYK